MTPDAGLLQYLNTFFARLDHKHRWADLLERPTTLAEAGLSAELPDNTFRVADNVDPTKKLAWEVSGIATATMRTWTVPDTDVTVSSFIAALLDDASATAALATLGVVVGTYAPTLDNTTNVAASSIASAICKYMQIGSFAIVVVVVNIDPTLAAPTTTVLGISLPVATDVTATTQVMGLGVENSASQQVGTVRGNIAGDRAELVFTATDAASRQWVCMFMYQI